MFFFKDGDLFMIICVSLMGKASSYWVTARAWLALANVMVSKEKSSEVVIIPQEIGMDCIIKEEIH